MSGFDQITVFDCQTLPPKTPKGSTSSVQQVMENLNRRCNLDLDELYSFVLLHDVFLGDLYSKNYGTRGRKRVSELSNNQLCVWKISQRCCCYTVSKADPSLYCTQGLMGILGGAISERISTAVHRRRAQFIGELHKKSQQSNNTCHPRL